MCALGGKIFAFFTKVLIQCKKYSKKQQNIKKILDNFWCFCYNENATQKRFYIDFNNHDYKKESGMKKVLTILLALALSVSFLGFDLVTVSAETKTKTQTENNVDYRTNY